MPIQAGSRPSELSTTMSMMSPALGTAAAPMLARVAVSTMVICWAKVRSTRWNCARKITATAW